MANKVNKLVKKYGKSFDKIRKKLEEEGIRYFLLKNDGRNGEYAKIAEITNCTKKYDFFRQQTNIRWATTNQQDYENLFQASDIGIGTESLLIYSIVREDLVPPDGFRPWWDIYCNITDGVIRYEEIADDDFEEDPDGPGGGVGGGGGGPVLEG